MCLGQGADLHMAQLMLLPLTISCLSKTRLVLPSLVLPFWCWLTQVVRDKIQEGCKTVVCACVHACVHTCVREHTTTLIIQYHTEYRPYNGYCLLMS